MQEDKRETAICIFLSFQRMFDPFLRASICYLLVAILWHLGVELVWLGTGPGPGVPWNSAGQFFRAHSLGKTDEKSILRAAWPGPEGARNVGDKRPSGATPRSCFWDRPGAPNFGQVEKSCSLVGEN